MQPISRRNRLQGLSEWSTGRPGLWLVGREGFPACVACSLTLGPTLTSVEMSRRAFRASGRRAPRPSVAGHRTPRSGGTLGADFLASIADPWEPSAVTVRSPIAGNARIRGCYGSLLPRDPLSERGERWWRAKGRGQVSTPPSRPPPSGLRGRGLAEVVGVGESRGVVVSFHLLFVSRLLAPLPHWLCLAAATWNRAGCGRRDHLLG